MLDIEPQSSAAVDVHLEANHSGVTEGYLHFDTNDPDQPRIAVHVSAVVHPTPEISVALVMDDGSRM